MPIIAVKTLERLILYRRQLLALFSEGKRFVFSHDLAAISGSTSAKVRRDLMEIGYSGSTVRGYEIKSLIRSLGDFIDASKPLSVILVGAGDLGKAIISYFLERREKLVIAAAFDPDAGKTDGLIRGCPCFHTDRMQSFIRENDIQVAILAVPAGEARAAAAALAEAGITGILNYAPVRLELPDTVYVENRDMCMALEKTAFYARASRERVTMREGFS
ncbi:redox-sensing transcriptional repressor Rex [bacterium]|nr:redox-sensing transcriptional repressor Rex [bacterium]